MIPTNIIVWCTSAGVTRVATRVRHLQACRLWNDVEATAPLWAVWCVKGSAVREIGRYQIERS